MLLKTWHVRHQAIATDHLTLIFMVGLARHEAIRRVNLHMYDKRGLYLAKVKSNTYRKIALKKNSMLFKHAIINLVLL